MGAGNYHQIIAICAMLPRAIVNDIEDMHLIA